MHDDFAPYFERLRKVRSFEPDCGGHQRDRSDGADVGGDVFTDGTVAARKSAGKPGRTVVRGFILKRE